MKSMLDTSVLQNYRCLLVNGFVIYSLNKSCIDCLLVAIHLYRCYGQPFCPSIVMFGLEIIEHKYHPSKTKNCLRRQLQFLSMSGFVVFLE